MTMTYIVDENNMSEYTFDLPNGNKKIIKYHNKENDFGLRLEATHMTIEIYDKEGNLISKTTEKNPHRIY